MIHSTFEISNPPIKNHFHPKKTNKSFSHHNLKFNYRNNISIQLTIIHSISKRTNNTMMLTSGASSRINALLSFHSLQSLFRLISAAFLLIFRGRTNEESSKGKVVRAMVVRKSKEVATRRAIAMRRVVEDRDGENTVRDYEVVTMGRGDTVFTQSWTPVKVQVRGLVVILHGLNEHSGRYNDFAKKLNANGFKVYGMDWIATYNLRKGNLVAGW